MEGSKLWKEVPINRGGWFAKAVGFMEYFGYFALTFIAALAVVFQATGKLSAPTPYTTKPPAWYNGPAGLCVSLPFALLGGWLLLSRLIDALLPASVFEGIVTRLEVRSVATLRTAIRDWFIWSDRTVYNFLLTI